MSVFGEKIEDYEILEHLGKGGFAHVYRARCHRTGIFVAIKMIDKALMANAGMIGRVRQEVTIHSRLKHPAILELYTFFEDAHYVYLVLELAHNGELAKHFKLRTLGLSEKAAADIFKQVVSGVLYLHTHNIIHRDLSLNNLLLTKDLNVKIADFGLATQLSEPDEKHVTMCGTPNYISPEVASREMHGLPADVWGLGCMLFTLLVGSPPFHTQHVKTTLNKVINADYKIPSNLSLYAQDLLQKLLCKDPKKRITLKGIMDHPFLQDPDIINTGKPDLSRDSGFLTTLHSTQHSNKIRNENNLNSNYLVNGSENNIANFIGKEECKVGSFNVFSGLQSNELSSNLSNGCNSYKICSIKDKPLTVLTTRHTPIQKFDSACNTNSLIESVNNLCTRSDNIPSTITPQENKENISKVCKSDTLGVPPLCAERLPTISHRTRNAILKIEPSGVIVEFIKKRGRDREEKIVEICEISKDGMKILIYSFDNVKDNLISNSTEKPSPNEIFSYHNLPQKHWKKYLYAARFVDLVKAKTPKITLYSPLGKCQLMENGTDIDLFFYSGEKVTFSASEGLKIIDKNSKTHYDTSGILELKLLVEHFEDCSNRIKRVQDALSTISDECFPLIIGKRPVPPSSPAPLPNQAQNYNTPTFNIGSFHRTIAASSQAQSDYNVT